MCLSNSLSTTVGWEQQSESYKHTEQRVRPGLGPLAQLLQLVIKYKGPRDDDPRTHHIPASLQQSQQSRGGAGRAWHKIFNDPFIATHAGDVRAPVLPVGVCVLVCVAPVTVITYNKLVPEKPDCSGAAPSLCSIRYESRNYHCVLLSHQAATEVLKN